jgi:hypothetical protein
MSSNARKKIEPFYAKLLELEKSGGVEASEKVLRDLLNGRVFNDVMLEMQKS